jgi:hypothetical protein
MLEHHVSNFHIILNGFLMAHQNSYTVKYMNNFFSLVGVFSSRILFRRSSSMAVFAATSLKKIVNTGKYQS